MPSSSSREEMLFLDALSQPPARRVAYVEEACASDAVLCARVLALLGAHAGPGSVLASPPLRAPAMRVDRPGEMISGYRLIQKVGEGACGVVWMAEKDEPGRRRVALKLARQAEKPRVPRADAASGHGPPPGLDHPNIARVFDWGETEDGRRFVVTDFVRGIAITKHCDRHHLTLTQRLELFIPVCDAIQQAHEHDLVHRDLKPSNVLITSRDGMVMAKVTDFLIAPAMDQRRDHNGSLAYLSPEELASTGGIDRRTDIYSLGAVLYELLSGYVPDESGGSGEGVAGEGARRSRTVPIRTPSQRVRRLDEAGRSTVATLRGMAPADLVYALHRNFDGIVMRCLQTEPARRYESARSLAADLGRFVRPDTNAPAWPLASARSVARRIRSIWRDRTGGTGSSESGAPPSR